MRVVIEFECDNAAFEDPEEIDQILNQAAWKIHQLVAGGRAEEKLRDTNGNVVGSLVLSEGEEERTSIDV